MDLISSLDSKHIMFRTQRVSNLYYMLVFPAVPYCSDKIWCHWITYSLNGWYSTCLYFYFSYLLMPEPYFFWLLASPFFKITTSLLIGFLFHFFPPALGSTETPLLKLSPLTSGTPPAAFPPISFSDLTSCFTPHFLCFLRPLPSVSWLHCSPRHL